MEKTMVLRFNILVAGILISVLTAACNKAEKREDNAGTEKVVPSEPKVNPCLRLAEDEEDHEHEEGEEHEDEDVEHDHEEEDIDDESGVGSTSTSSGCEKNPPATTPADPVEPAKTSGTYSVGPGILGCEEKSEAWIAVKNGGSGVCEGTLVKYCCSAPEIATRFPTVADKLAPKITAMTDAGLKLYHCSEKDGKTIFHFASSKGTAVSYKTIFVGKTGSKEGDTKGESCPVVTLKDMGFEEKAKEEVTEQVKIPAKIGEIEDTTKAGILAFLKTKEHQSWRGDTTFRNVVPHGKVKIFYNPKLEKSLEDGKDKHEVGSIAVREIYKGSDLEGYAVLGKHKTGDGKESWFFYETGGKDFADVKAHAVGSPSSCVECHTKGKDFIQSKMQAK